MQSDRRRRLPARVPVLGAAHVPTRFPRGCPRATDHRNQNWNQGLQGRARAIRPYESRIGYLVRRPAIATSMCPVFMEYYTIADRDPSHPAAVVIRGRNSPIQAAEMRLRPACLAV